MNLLVRDDLEDLQQQNSFQLSRQINSVSSVVIAGAGVNRDWLGMAPLMGACCSDLSYETPVGEVTSAGVEGDELSNVGSYFRKSSGGTLLAGGVPSLGGIFQVFQHARSLAIEIGLYSETDSVDVLTSPEVRRAFSNHVISVTSSSNVGLAVGLAARALGFVAEVHFSAATAQWKIDVLRKQGATVASHRGNFQDAAAVVRAQAQADPMVYHVDDTRQVLLSSGFSAMALELQAQLLLQGVHVNRNTKLHLHFCKQSNSGQSPFALEMAMRRVFGNYVQCTFDESRQADAALGLVAGSYHSDSFLPLPLDGEMRDRATRVVWVA